jgi:tetratricopeptide (TPR) repeat protein
MQTPGCGDFGRRAVTIMRALSVTRTGLSRLLLTALASGLAATLGCASNPVDTSAAAEKNYGARMAKQGYWHEALFRFRRAIALAPNDAEIQNDLAVAYEAVGETANALAAYRRALELAPEETHIRRNYARFAEYYTASQRAGTGADVPPPPSPTPHP